MSTKSDFAQKLLNDLRMRKERMAAASQSSSAHSTQLTVATTSDAYGNPKQANQGSRQIKTLESAGLKPTMQHKRSNMIIVPFKGGQQNQNSPKLGDLSMVLTFALDNGIKLIGSNGNNNNQALRRSVSHQLPTLSTTHINDISKGAHKLNEILRAYSNGNGVNIDRHSVEIGNQLLKGAMDLGESLRMLVNLQEASEYMSTPNRKNQIRLLDEEEEDDEVDNNELANKQKQLVLPRFSFDKPRKNDQEKGRISSVIAKLMGLDDMSNNVRINNMRKESSSEQKVTAAGLKNSDSGNRNNHRITHLAIGKPKERTRSSSKNRSTLHSKQRDLDGLIAGNSEERRTERREISGSRKPIVLTEDEAHLKLILIKSQLFIHTAVALFKLDFPVGILHISDYSNSPQAKEEKVIIDCGYEITRRKGRRQDESVKLSYSSVRIDSLDELVRRLNEELGNLKSYGMSELGESDDKLLINMLEKDIGVNKNPDINCMWDLGWNDAMFAVAEREETIRDVEKQVLNGLLDEVTTDLLSPLMNASFF